MPSVRSLAFKCAAYYFKLIAVILSLSEIMPTYSCYAEKKLVYIIIMAPLSCQPSSYIKYTKSNMRSSYNVRSVSNTKCIFLVYLYTL